MLVRTEDIIAAVEALPEFREASTVLAFWSVRDEVPTHAFLQRWLGKKRLVLPRVAGEMLELREYVPELMVPGAFGIMEPSVQSPLVDPSTIEFALVPGQAFDSRGNRKGHGKGYYDRLLPTLHCRKAGVAPSSRIVSRLYPAPWDVPVDIVITDFSLSL